MIDFIVFDLSFYVWRHLCYLSGLSFLKTVVFGFVSFVGWNVIYYVLYRYIVHFIEN